jgi:cytochrome c-type biogenesis protein CcmH/NrfG
MNSFSRKVLIFALAFAAVATVGWFGRKAYKAATERRLLAEAQKYASQKDLRNATLCLQRVLQLDPMSVVAARTAADMLEGAGAPAALSWRIRAAQLRPAEMEYRFAWAKTALKIHDERSASDALSGVDDAGKTTAAYHKLRGALSWDLRNVTEADKEYSEALRLEPTNEAIVLNLATIHLASTNVNTVNAARSSLGQIAASSHSEIHATALHYLAADAETHKLYEKAIDYSTKLLKEPAATFEDKIVHLQYLSEAKDKDAPVWLKSLEKQATASPVEAFLLGKWMASRDPATALGWLQSLPLTIQTNQPVPLIVTDCQVALNHWADLLALVNREDWGELNSYRLALESLAQRSQGQKTAATVAWQKAVRLASTRLDSLSRLSQVAAAWRWVPEHTEILQKITVAFPKERWAVDQLIKQMYADGNTLGIQQLLANVQRDNPTDARLKNNLANVYLLRNSDLEKANELAKEAYDASPNDPYFVSTYAYSLLLQNKRDDALKVISRTKSEYLLIPAVAAYYGVVEAQCGNYDIAKDPLKRAEAAKLLPEEKELVRRAIARL